MAASRMHAGNHFEEVSVLEPKGGRRPILVAKPDRCDPVPHAADEEGPRRARWPTFAEAERLKPTETGDARSLMWPARRGEVLTKPSTRSGGDGEDEAVAGLVDVEDRSVRPDSRRRRARGRQRRERAAAAEHVAVGGKPDC